MKYMLLMQGPLGEYKKNVESWSPDVLKDHMQFMHELNEDLSARVSSSTGKGWPPRKRRASSRLRRTVRSRSPTAHLPKQKNFSLGTGSSTASPRSVRWR